MNISIFSFDVTVHKKVKLDLNVIIVMLNSCSKRRTEAGEAWTLLWPMVKPCSCSSHELMH